MCKSLNAEIHRGYRAQIALAKHLHNMGPAHMQHTVTFQRKLWDVICQYKGQAPGGEEIDSKNIVLKKGKIMVRAKKPRKSKKK